MFRRDAPILCLLPLIESLQLISELFLDESVLHDRLCVHDELLGRRHTVYGLQQDFSPSLSLIRFRQSITLWRKTHWRYNESVHRKEQLATIINTITILFDFIHVYFPKRRIQCNIAHGLGTEIYQDVSKANQFDHCQF